MDYEQTLAALVELMGRTVNVQVAPAKEQQPIASALAVLSGELRGADDMIAPETRLLVGGEDEFLGFEVGEGARFLVHRASFERAAWIGSALLIYMRGAVIVVNPT